MNCLNHKMNRVRRIRDFLCLCCLFCMVAGCQQAENPEPSPESSADATLPQEEPRPASESQPEQAHSNSARSEGEQVSVVLEGPEQPVQPGARFPMTVKFEIAALWEIRTLDARPEKLATQLKLKLPEGFQSTGEWQAPEAGRSLSLDSHPVYAGEADFRQTIEVAPAVKPGTYKLSCQVQYQTCDEQRCLSPVKKTLEVLVRVGESQKTN